MEETQMTPVMMLITAGALMFIVIGGLAFCAHVYTLNGIKSRTVGDGQHGTARWATPQEIKRIYKHVPFEPELWRQGKNLPTAQGIIVGSKGPKGRITALVDDADVHALMIGAAGIGKTAFWLYPNLEYACATRMSFLTTDTKGDLMRYYARIARECYGYNVSIIDLRNPTKSDGNNMLHLVNKYMDIFLENGDLSARAKAERYAKVVSKTIITSSGDSSDYGQNAFFYDSAEGLLTAVILLLAEYLPPTVDENGEVTRDCRHIISVYKLTQDLLGPSKVKGKNRFQVLMDKLPPDHKARWFAGSALNTAEQAMASVLSTVLSRLNTFLDTEMEQILCFDTALDAERFCTTPSAIFLTLPEEDVTKYFLASLTIQQLYREILTVADQNGGKLANRVIFYCDELGTLPKMCETFPSEKGGRHSIGMEELAA